MEYEAAERADQTSPDSERDKPSNKLKARSAHYVGTVECGIEKKDSEASIGEE
ncbi:hypothetical protein SS1G_03329 [Sclerotinia sclerotiorum 1980 UF-70]|uniref:Uncharacterized protein n=1 Tax=Sclerotinia sclerotiorum (strain ATCC 18683 / 1980 / Ss-1) TaxID=665079 RepID=A7EDD9_SCLS1|nr:hypothetical protein SS1G_03329 [Sclerotinia sclerotiorum 1980 UF-70]EDO00855.1 hypothetical protein SS1G_03329 [Sclerotinia sclerotiorum 1980 UF-70]